MDPMRVPIGADVETVVCPNCANRQGISGIAAKCERCGYEFDPTLLQAAGVAGGPIAGESSPWDAASPIVAGGLGGETDGTQVVHHSTSAVPGKPMAPIADDSAGGSTLEGQAMDTPSSSAHAERGGG